MTADDCDYWDGGECLLQYKEGITCLFLMTDVVTGEQRCSATNEDLVTEEEYLLMEKE